MKNGKHQRAKTTPSLEKTPLLIKEFGCLNNAVQCLRRLPKNATITLSHSFPGSEVRVVKSGRTVNVKVAIMSIFRGIKVQTIPAEDVLHFDALEIGLPDSLSPTPDAIIVDLWVKNHDLNCGANPITRIYLGCAHPDLCPKGMSWEEFMAFAAQWVEEANQLCGQGKEAKK